MGVLYKDINGNTKKVSEEFIMKGIPMIWDMYCDSVENDSKITQDLLREAHSILCASLYGTIIKEMSEGKV